MTKETKTQEEAVAVVDTSEVLAELLASVQELRNEQLAQRAQFELEKAELEARLAAQKAEPADPYRPAVAPPGMINLEGDGPELNIDRKLDTMQAVAEYNGVVFNREQVRRSLLGLPPEEEPIKFLFNGRAFDSQEDMDEYIGRIETEQKRSLGKYR